MPPNIFLLIIHMLTLYWLNTIFVVFRDRVIIVFFRQPNHRGDSMGIFLMTSSTIIEIENLAKWAPKGTLGSKVLMVDQYCRHD